MVEHSEEAKSSKNNVDAGTSSLARFQQISGFQSRVISLIFVSLAIVLLFVAISLRYPQRTQVCTGDECDFSQLSRLEAETLQENGVAISVYAFYATLCETLTVIAFVIIMLLIFRRKSHLWVAWVFYLCLIMFGLTNILDIFTVQYPTLHYLSAITEMIIWAILLPIFLFLFPDGRFVPGWTRHLMIIITVVMSLITLFLMSNTDLTQSIIIIQQVIWFGIQLAGIVAQIYRYIWVSNSVQRQQTRWFVFGLVITAFGSGLTITLLNIGIPLEDPGLAGLISKLVEITFINIAISFFPMIIGIAILRYKLWDIDIIINRTLVYGLLTAMLIAIYAFIVSSLGFLLQDEGNFVVSLLGAGVIAVIFQPLRNLVQRAINRWIFGQRDEPLAVMIELGKSLEMIASPEAALSYLVETTGKTLKLPYVAIQQNDHSELISFGKSVTQPNCFPLTYQARNIGTLLVSSRSPDEKLSTTDKLVLENVARQVSNLVHATRLTADLQQSRQEILTTREEERRRLRRDLHDGLGPALATLTLQAEAASELLSTNPAKSEALLQEIIRGSQSTLSEIRRIVYALRPPALDDLGLISAIQEQASRYTKKDLVILVEVPEQFLSLPAAVEVATYRIVQEALTNVARHSHARNCKVSIRCNGQMNIEVKDDGIGIPVQQRSGVGLNSIHERATELGGSCIIKSKEGEGTHIIVSLPIE